MYLLLFLEQEPWISVSSVQVSAVMRVGDTDTDTATKGRSRSYSPLEPPSSDHIHHLKRSKTSSSSKLMMDINIGDLPDVVLVEILCRLPCNKLVFQCRCVSKRWCTLISNPYFICRFLRLQIDKQMPTKVTLINPKGEEIHSRMSSPVFKRLMTVHGLKEEPVVVGTYNDLVLCCATKYHQRDYYICNPYTAQWVALPPAPTQWKWPVPVGFICDVPYYNYKQDDARKGSYNVQVNAEYRCKVVRVLPIEQYDEKYGSFKLTLELFSFETGEWRVSVVLAPLSFRTIDRYFSVTYNGMLYWWDDAKLYNFPCLMGLDPFIINNSNSTGTSSSNGDGVIDYYKCRVLKFADPAVVDDPARDVVAISCIEFLGVCGECVRMCDFINHLRTLYVYELKEEQDDRDQMDVDGASKFCLERTRVYSLDQNMFLGGYKRNVELIACDPNNVDILYLNIEGDVFMCDVGTREWSKLAAKESNLNINGCFFKFVLPWWPTPVPRLPQRVLDQLPHGGGISS